MQPQTYLLKPEIERLSKNKTHNRISLDETFGLLLVKTKSLTERRTSNHLSDKDVYRRFSKEEIPGQLEGFKRLIELFISQLGQCTPLQDQPT